MKSNPGGNIPPDQAVGRNDLAEALWAQLDRQSIRLTAERRMGKTTLVKLMRAQAPDGTATVFRDVGGLTNVAEFVERVTQDIETLLVGKNYVADRVRKFLVGWSGTEFQPLLNRETLLHLLRKMQRDHYLARVGEAAGRFTFLFPLIQRWWCRHRELA